MGMFDLRNVLHWSITDSIIARRAEAALSLSEQEAALPRCVILQSIDARILPAEARVLGA